MKRSNRNWNDMQLAYDGGMTWRDIQSKFNVCNATLAWARKNGHLNCRTISVAQKMAWKNGNQNADVFRTPEFRKKQSKFGGIKERAGRCKYVNYVKPDGIPCWLQGSWEVKLAEFLDSKRIVWDRNKVGYKYDFLGKTHLYFPDFYLKDLELYIEVKGYETDKDKEKWKQFPFKLLIVKKKEIQDLDAWWKEIKL